MSDNNLPHIFYGLDSPGRIVRIESSITTRPNIGRLSSIEETLRRLSTNLRPERQTNESNNGKIILINAKIVKIIYVLIITFFY